MVLGSLLQGPLIPVSVRQQVQNLLDSYPEEYLDLYRDHLRAVYQVEVLQEHIALDTYPAGLYIEQPISLPDPPPALVKAWKDAEKEVERKKMRILLSHWKKRLKCAVAEALRPEPTVFGPLGQPAWEMERLNVSSAS